MAILRSIDGKFYDVPEEDLANYEVPADRVNAFLGAANIGQSRGPMSGPGRPGPGGPMRGSGPGGPMRGSGPGRQSKHLRDWECLSYG